MASDKIKNQNNLTATLTGFIKRKILYGCLTLKEREGHQNSLDLGKTTSIKSS